MILQSKIIQNIYFSILFVFFINLSRESYNAIANWLSDARSLASPNIVIILCGNKKDLDDQRQVTFLEANRFAQENGKNELIFVIDENF